MEMREILINLMKLHGDDAYSLEEKSKVPQPTTPRYTSGKYKTANAETVKKWAGAYAVSESQLRVDLPIPGINEFSDCLQGWTNEYQG